MPARKIEGSTRGATIRLLRGLSFRRKVAIGLAAPAAIVAGVIAHQWWTAWTPRLALRSSGVNYPPAFSVDGSTIATGSPGEGIKLWDAKDGRPKAHWPSPDGRRWSIGKFSPDGRSFAAWWFLMATPGQRHVDLIDPETGRARWSVVPTFDNILGLDFRDEGRTLRVISSDQATRAYVDLDVATGQPGPVRTLPAPLPKGATFASEDGRYLSILDRTTAGPGGFRRILFWDVDGDRPYAEIPGFSSSETVYSIGLAPDGQSVAISFEDRSVQVWDVAPPRLRSRFLLHGPDYQGIRLFLSPGGSKLASLGRFGKPALSLDTLRFLFHRIAGDPNVRLTELVVFDVADGRALGRSTEEGLATVFSKDDRALATSHVDCNTRLRDLPAGR